MTLGKIIQERKSKKGKNEKRQIGLIQSAHQPVFNGRFDRHRLADRRACTRLRSNNQIYLRKETKTMTETPEKRAQRLQQEYENLQDKHRKEPVTGGRNARIAERRHRLDAETAARLAAEAAAREARESAGQADG